MIHRRFYHIAHTIRRTNISGIDPETGRACLRCFDTTLIMKVNIRDNRNSRLPDNLFERCGACLIRTGNPDNVRPCLFQRMNLCNRRLGVRCQRIGHRLHRNRCITTNGNIANINLARFPAVYLSVRSDAHGIILYKMASKNAAVAIFA